MFIVELSFSDTPARLALRPRHRELLAELHAGGELLNAGPLADGAGSVLLLTTTRERVDEILAADPYYAAEGVTVAAVRELTLLFDVPGARQGEK
ncbi:MAG: YciI family protein [Actinomycetota bacterium]|nr:YciI family protein [Actinomycetota bacterium]